MTRSSATMGPWAFEDGYAIAGNGMPVPVVGVQIPIVVGPKRLEAIHNTKLLVEAGTVLHENGLSPREPVEDREDSILDTKGDA